MSDINIKNGCISFFYCFWGDFFKNSKTMCYVTSFSFLNWLLVILGQICGLSRNDLAFVTPETYTILFKKKNRKESKYLEWKRNFKNYKF